ncbi:MAG: T9SS type A sorting domain-containing protein [Bacteroidota bacterium]
MKKTIYYCIISLLIFHTHSLSGQYKLTTLETSKVSHSFSNNGNLRFIDLDGNNYYNPTNNGSGFNLGYFNGLMLSGVDPEGNIPFTLNFYRGNDAYLPGILSMEGEPIPDGDQYFNRIWQINSEDIQVVKTLFEQGLLTQDDLPADIAEWPAKGNSNFGLVLDNELAPFYDHDTDGNYNPLQGDLPIPIEEKQNFLPSKFTFCVYYNNVFSAGGEADKHGLEIIQINYTLDCEENDLEDAIFTRVKIKNKGDNLSEFKMGMFIDYDLGCFTDDNFGTNVSTNSVYAYNEDGFDSSPCVGNYNSISPNMSAIYSTVLLSHPFHSTMPFYSQSIPVPEPNTSLVYHELLNGNFADGTSLTFGGNGYDTLSNMTTKFVFPDLPNNPQGWHMNNADGLVNFFTRAIIPSIDLGDFDNGESRTIDFADVLLPFDQTSFTIFNEYESRINNFKSSYALALDTDAELACFNHPFCEEDCVWPGDVNNNGRVEANDITYLATMAGDVIANANRRDRISTEWRGFNSEPWQTEKSGIDYRYADVNGNGEVNLWDIALLTENFRLTNEIYEKEPDNIPSFDERGLSVDILFNEEISPVNGILNKIARARIMLGDEDLMISEPIFSLSFDLLIDTEIVHFSPWYFNDNHEIFDRLEHHYELKDSNSDPLPIADVFNYSERQSFVSFQMNEPIEQGGELLENITIAAHNLGYTQNPNGEEYTKIEIVNVLALDKEGNQIDLGIRSVDSVLVKDLILDPSLNTDNETDQPISVFPNPTRDKLSVHLQNSSAGRLEIRNMQGRLIEKRTMNSSEYQLDTSGWENGVYILCIFDKEHAFTKRVVKM